MEAGEVEISEHIQSKNEVGEMNLNLVYDDLKNEYQWLIKEDDKLHCKECFITFDVSNNQNDVTLNEIKAHNSHHFTELSNCEFNFDEFCKTKYWTELRSEFPWLYINNKVFGCMTCEEAYKKLRGLMKTSWTCPEKMPKITINNFHLYIKRSRFGKHQETTNHERADFILKYPFTESSVVSGPNSPIPNVKTRHSMKTESLGFDNAETNQNAIFKASLLPRKSKSVFLENLQNKKSLIRKNSVNSLTKDTVAHKELHNEDFTTTKESEKAEVKINNNLLVNSLTKDTVAHKELHNEDFTTIKESDTAEVKISNEQERNDLIDMTKLTLPAVEIKKIDVSFADCANSFLENNVRRSSRKSMPSRKRLLEDNVIEESIDFSTYSKRIKLNMKSNSFSGKKKMLPNKIRRISLGSKCNRKPLFEKEISPLINNKLHKVETINLKGVSKRKSVSKKLISIDRTIKPSFIEENLWIKMLNDHSWLYSTCNELRCLICEEAFKKYTSRLKKTRWTSPDDPEEFKNCQEENLSRNSRLSRHENTMNHIIGLELLNNAVRNTINVDGLDTYSADVDKPDFMSAVDFINLKSKFSWLILNKTGYGCQLCLDCFAKEPNDLIKSRFTQGIIEFETEEKSFSIIKARISKHQESVKHKTSVDILNSLKIKDLDQKHTRLRGGIGIKIDYRRLSDGKFLEDPAHYDDDNNNKEKLSTPGKDKLKDLDSAVLCEKEETDKKHSKIVSCPQCKSNFNEVKDLIKHIELCDDPSNDVIACPCDPAQYQFHLITKFDLHASQEHASQSLFSCYICSNRYTRVSELFIHILDNHLIFWDPYFAYSPQNLIKEYKCMFCTDRFALNSELTKHYCNSACSTYLNVTVVITEDCIVNVDNFKMNDEVDSVQLESIEETETNVVLSGKERRNLKHKIIEKKSKNKKNNDSKKIKNKLIDKNSKKVVKKGRKITLGITKKYRAGKEISEKEKTLKKIGRSLKGANKKSMISKTSSKQKQSNNETIQIITTKTDTTPPKPSRKFAVIFHSQGSPKKFKINSDKSKTSSITEFIDDDKIHLSAEKIAASVTSIEDLKPSSNLSFMERMKQIRLLKKIRSEKMREEIMNNNKRLADKNIDKKIIITNEPKIVECSENTTSVKPKELHTCKLCGTNFKSISARDQHIRIMHKGQKYFQCKLCGMHFETHLTLRKHAQRYHGEKSGLAVFGKESAAPKCEKCGMWFINKTGLRLHLMTVHGEKKQKISNGELDAKLGDPSIGSDSFSDAGDVVIKRLAGANWESDPQTCSVCKEVLANDLEFLIHTLDHEKETGNIDSASAGQFACPNCCRLFFGRNGKLYLKDHYNMVHLRRPQPTCENCQIQFESTYCYQVHKDMATANKSCSKDHIPDPYIALQSVERLAFVCNYCQALFAGNSSKIRFEAHHEVCKGTTDSRR